MLKTPRRIFFLLIFLTLFLIAVDLPDDVPIRFKIGNVSIDQTIPSRFKTHLGLDLSGGAQLTLEANMKDIAPDDRVSALESAKEVIERRINLFGVSEAVIQSAHTADSYRVIVELPGVTDVNRAVELIGQTAMLEFREFDEESQSTTAAYLVPMLENTVSTGLTGKDLKRAQVRFSSQTGEPEVGIEFTAEGAQKFADITRRLIGKPLVIFLDDIPVTAPRVNTEILDGQAVITGSFTQEGAKMLALQLNAGALPVPVTVVEKRTVGATLGEESVV
jgi:preprotein translocase subunit SecD